MQTRDEVEGLHNCLEFSQPVGCLYQEMQTWEKKFSIAFIKQLSPEKRKTLLFRALIKEKFLPVVKSCTMKLVCIISLCFAKKMLSKLQFSSLKSQLK